MNLTLFLCGIILIASFSIQLISQNKWARCIHGCSGFSCFCQQHFCYSSESLFREGREVTVESKLILWAIWYLSELDRISQWYETKFLRDKNSKTDCAFLVLSIGFSVIGDRVSDGATKTLALNIERKQYY